MKFLLLISSLIFLSSNQTLAGNKKFTHEDALTFERMYGRNITDNGKFVTYYSKPSRGDNKLHLRNLETEEYIYFDRAKSLKYDLNTTVFGFLQTAEAIEIANSEKKKPHNKLKLYYPEGSRFEEIEDVKSFAVAGSGEWVMYRGYDENKNPDKKSHKKFGTELTLRHLDSGTEIVLDDIIDFAIDSTGTHLAYSVSGKNEKRDGLYYRNMNEPFIPETTVMKDSNGLFHHMIWDHDRSVLAFLHAKQDTNGYNDNNALYTYKPKEEPIKIVDSDLSVNGSQWHIFADDPMFSEDGSKIYYSSRPAWRIIHKEDEDEVEDWNDSTYYDFDRILKDRKINVWHWDDPSIVTVEETNWNQTKSESFLGVYNSKTDKSYQLADTNLVSPDGLKYSERYLLMRDNDKYARDVTWYGWFFDLYLADTETGDVKLIADSLEHTADISPDGKYSVWYRQGDWFLYDNGSGELNNISEGSGITFQNQEEDRPREPGSYGFMGWEKGSNNPIFYDRNDAYLYDRAVTKTFRNLTENYRDSPNHRFRYSDTDRDDPYININSPMIFSVWDYSEKSTSLYVVNPLEQVVEKKLEGDYNYKIGDIADDAYKILFTKENYRTFPDIYVSDINLNDTNKVSDLHPYYLEDYNWGQPMQLKWMAENGDTLYGTYILPDDYNPKKKYPVFIYYYEKFGDRRNQWNQPVVNHRPNYQSYVSDGYIMFLPDIYFREGDPGPSSTRSMLDAMNALEKAASIDKDKVILHGHSWSGYQSAYIGTQTDYFAGIITGAPVSNMTSAYSGIRLGSGLARQFQYERGQSRIGGNLIDSLDAYIRNSPVFFADKMNTPMLIQFGDVDDAVPYSQGVELYLALRRFQKPAIMLQYEGEPHHLKKFANKLDYLIKMKEFADYHVGKLEEKPDWMDGVPYWRGK
jgi:dipeptidyl aminopeptidase/acylaminoacyl peptidase